MSRTGKKLSEEVKNKVIGYASEGKSTVEITRILAENDDCITTRQSIRRLLKKFKETGSIRRRSASTIKKILPVHVSYIGQCIKSNPEITTTSIQEELRINFDLEISTAYISSIRKQLGWKQAVPGKYCQLISHKNKRARLEWCLQALQRKDTFEDVIFMDETSIEMNSHGRITFNRASSRMECQTTKTPKPKHPYKVHFWGGISYRGRTNCSVFTGIMDSVTYQAILRDNLLPFVATAFPDGFRLYQDNDSKHKSKSTKEWMSDRGILNSVMDVPASSPDINPIENVWSAMKTYLMNTVKPTKKDDLVRGIQVFWDGLSAQKCSKYINHIQKVLPEVILNHGEATQY